METQFMKVQKSFKMALELSEQEYCNGTMISRVKMVWWSLFLHEISV